MLHPTSSPDPRAAAKFSRRRVLAGGGGGLLALALIGTTATACGPTAPPAPDPLETELDSARRDSELATAAAAAAAPAVAPALRVIADERARHATALVEELARAAGEPTPTATAESSAATSTTGPEVKPAPPPTLRDVASALRTSADNASKLVPTLSGYRAGLLGSIAAACTAAYTVGLQPDDRKPR